MSNNDHDLGEGFGARAGMCGLGAYSHGTGFCKDGCGKRVMLGGFSGYCAECAPKHGMIEPIKIGPDAVTPAQLLEPAKQLFPGCRR